ncbi:LON peptidase substrate-binding domain-containing protein [Sulfuriroseicoccus oceanibius]|uniref:LON peptidase substrate-binding domain-containing protein n=1 Tax=Sulfuriroseicoccus oceanibius TaxID=2707525 RepID=A0A6B3L104_9BACT|nr:LON peptidase substrate-binding domain-containing protein [Sulfuriroseicoccus oceanibius]QQL46314.1 LON peptidase substrate-binding domain-containing protein [Sulfuriroseicoccus oceanibius]
MIDHKPKTLPAIILPECVLLPHCGLPLHIHEERYRAMIKDALQSHRMMCVATKAPDHDLTPNANEIEAIGTAGVIRACVGQSDGSSNLMLQGVGRVHFDHWHLENDAPYPLADLTWIDEDQSKSPRRADALRNEVINILNDRLCQEESDARQLLDHLQSTNDPGQVADLVAYHILGDDTQLMRSVLEATDHSDRLELVCARLHTFH